MRWTIRLTLDLAASGWVPDWMSWGSGMPPLRVIAPRWWIPPRSAWRWLFIIDWLIGPGRIVTRSRWHSPAVLDIRLSLRSLPRIRGKRALAIRLASSTVIIPSMVRRHLIRPSVRRFATRHLTGTDDSLTAHSMTIAYCRPAFRPNRQSSAPLATPNTGPMLMNAECYDDRVIKESPRPGSLMDALKAISDNPEDISAARHFLRGTQVVHIFMRSCS